jgi:hypothetical protein
MSLTREFKNFIKGSLNTALGSSAVTASVNFDTNTTAPSGLSATNYMMMVIDPDATEHASEIVKVTGIQDSGPHTLTIVRAQEGTSAQNWDTDRKIVAPLTAGIVDDFMISTANFTYDHSNERLGIKDTASSWSGGGPAEALHINHSDATIKFTNTDTTANSFISADESDGSVVIDADTDSAVSSGSTAKVILKTAQTERARAHAGGFTITGALAKTSGTFDIEHPTQEGMRLRHSFIEGPQADLIYRGMVMLEGGRAEVNIDEVSGMTEGTWQALSREPWSIVSCPAGESVTWSINENILTIEGQDGAIAMWIVISERQDKDMKSEECGIADSTGRLVVEYEAE